MVSTAVMGKRDIVGPRRGALEVPEDEEAFAGALCRLLPDGERRARTADDARAFAREWSARAMAERVADLYAAASAARVPAPEPRRADNP